MVGCVNLVEKLTRCNHEVVCCNICLVCQGGKLDVPVSPHGGEVNGGGLTPLWVWNRPEKKKTSEKQGLPLNRESLHNFQSIIAICLSNNRKNRIIQRCLVAEGCKLNGGASPSTAISIIEKCTSGLVVDDEIISSN
jgi:hypothetical protein